MTRAFEKSVNCGCSAGRPAGRRCFPQSDRGQVAVELAFQIPLMIILLFGAVQIAKIFYVYHTLQKALRGGAAYLARSANVDYCNTADTTMTATRNLIVYGNLQGEGLPVMQGLMTDMIQILPEREVADTNTLQECPCTEDSGGCSIASGGSPPDFVTINLGGGFPLTLPFPYVDFGTVNLKVSVRMPVTGG